MATAPTTAGIGEFAKRVVVSLILIPTVIWIVWLGGLPLALLLAVVSAIAAWEFYRLVIGTGSTPLWGHGVVFAALIPIAEFARFAGWWVPPVSIVMLVVLELLGVSLWVRGAEGKPLEVVGTTLLGAFYAGGMMTFGFELRYHRFVIEPIAGTLLVVLPLIITWGTDTAAMLFGRAFGKTKLMPRVSPKKTVVGAVAGVVVSAILAAAYVRFALRPYAHLAMGLPTAAAFGFVVSVAGQVGDLVESMLKRQAGVKDSSALIPGHGGALDRIDSLLFTLPVSYVLLDLLLIPTP